VKKLIGKKKKVQILIGLIEIGWGKAENASGLD